MNSTKKAWKKKYPTPESPPFIDRGRYEEKMFQKIDELKFVFIKEIRESGMKRSKEHNIIRNDIYVLSEKLDNDLLSEIHKIHSQYERLLKEINLINYHIDPKIYEDDINKIINCPYLWKMLKEDEDFFDVLLYLMNGFLYMDLIFSEKIKLKNLELFECTPLAIEFFKALETFLYTVVRNKIKKNPIFIWNRKTNKKDLKIIVKKNKFYINNNKRIHPTFGSLLIYINTGSKKIEYLEGKGAGMLINGKNALEKWCRVFPNNQYKCRNWDTGDYICHKCKKVKQVSIKYKAEEWLNQVRNSKVHHGKIPAEKAREFLDSVIDMTFELILSFHSILMD